MAKANKAKMMENVTQATPAIIPALKSNASVVEDDDDDLTIVNAWIWSQLSLNKIFCGSENVPL